jgi:3'-phosphoadenosine 5'-phosphosulfate sulfotransferase (PAPS reductase)/FAD synthetase
VRHIISLGAGVQSSTMALMAAAGEITPMPECAIFADTGREPSAVYRWLDWLEKQLPFPVLRVSYGDLGAMIGKKPNGRYGYMPMPAFVRGADGQEALLNRSCTRDFKIRPIRRKVRELVGLTRRRSPLHAVVSAVDRH